jgi:hypothetical protein
MELAFFSAWAEKRGDRPYDLVDVTGREKPAVVSIVSECINRAKPWLYAARLAAEGSFEAISDRPMAKALSA